MAKYKIKLFAHGVPNGQDIWGNPGADAKYIEAFYSRQSNIPSQMLLEVMQFGSETNSYYTYFRGDIQEKGGRKGGYFALTIRIDHYYTDIQNVYNLIEAAFNKFIIGTVLEQTQGEYRFLVPQLSQADDTLKALEKEIEHYLMQFSSDADFVSLSGFKCNGQNEFGIINLLEASASTVAKHVKSTGKISVSSFHPSSKEQQIMKEANEKVQDTNKRAQQQIAAIEQKAQNDITSIQNSERQKVQSAIKEKEDEANKRISSLNSELQNMRSYKTKYEKAQSDLDKSNKVIFEIKKSLSGLNGKAENLGMSSVPDGGNSTHYTSNDQEVPKKKSRFMRIVKNLHPFIDLIVMVILVGIVLQKNCTSSENSGAAKKLSTAKQTEEQHKPKAQNTNNHGSATEATEIEQSLQEEFSKASIDIKDYDPKYPMKKGKEYQISLKDVTTDKKIVWESKDFKISEDKIIPKHPGKCIIYCLVGGEKVKSREIIVNQ